MARTRPSAVDRTARTRTRRFRAAAVSGGVILALGMGEIAVRTLAPVRWERISACPVPAEARTSPHGLREWPILLPDDPNCLRIAFLGDSFTYGVNVPEDLALVRQVDRFLKERWTGPYATINLGVPGADTITEWALLNRLGQEVCPHVVVHVLSPNDMDVDDYKDLTAIARFSRERCWLSKYSRLFGTADASVRSAIVRRRYLDYVRGGATPPRRDRAWRIVSREIEATKHLAESEGAVYVVVRFPEFLVDLRHYELGEPHRWTAELAGRIGAAYLDLLEVYRDRDHREMAFGPGDDHPSPAAYAIAGRAIADFLAGRVLPGIRPRPIGDPPVKRTDEQITAAEVQHYRRILDLDPSCWSARFWLRKATEPSEHSPAPQGSRAHTLSLGT